MNPVLSFGTLKTLFSKLLPKGSLSRNATLVVLGDGITFTSTFVTGMILARIISVEAMATYRQVIYLGNLAQSIVSFSLSSSIYRFWNLLDDIRRSTYIKMQLMLSMALGGVASLALAALAPLLANWYQNPDLRTALLICCASPLVNIVPLTIRPVLICRGKPLAATFIQTAFSLAMVLAIIIPFYLSTDLFKALTVWMVVNFIEVFLTFIILRTEINQRSPWWDHRLFIDSWNYLWPIQAGRIPGIVTQYTDKIATSVFLSTESFAVYSLGARELPFIGKIGPSLSSVLIPKLVSDFESGNVSSVCRRWKSACFRTSIVTYPIIGFCIWFSDPIVRFLYSAKYSESSVPFAVYSAITFVRVIEYASLAKALGRTDLIMKSAIVSAVTMVGLSFPLTAWFGIPGMLLAVLSSVLVGNGFYLFSYTKIFGVTLAYFFPWKQLIMIASISVGSAAIIGTLLDPVAQLSGSASMVVTGINLIFVFTLHIILYILLILAVRIVNLDAIFRVIQN